MKKHIVSALIIILSFTIVTSCKKSSSAGISVQGNYHISATATVTNGVAAAAQPVGGCFATNEEYFGANGIYNETTGCEVPWSGNYYLNGDTLAVWDAGGVKTDQGVIRDLSSTGFKLDESVLNWGQNYILTFVKD